MLIVDNYDSFTYNIVEYIKILGVNPIVVKNNHISIDEIKKLDFSRIIISPGWGNPANSGVSMDVIAHFSDTKPILGVCLGMQCIAKYWGAKIIKAKEPCHGKCSKIYFNKDFPLFFGIPQGFLATRYHSLVVGEVNNAQIELMAYTKDNLLMALKIKNKNVFGVQFHPEAHLSEFGLDIFRNFISIQ